MALDLSDFAFLLCIASLTLNEMTTGILEYENVSEKKFGSV